MILGEGEPNTVPHKFPPFACDLNPMVESINTNISTMQECQDHLLHKSVHVRHAFTSQLFPSTLLLTPSSNQTKTKPTPVRFTAIHSPPFLWFACWMTGKKSNKYSSKWWFLVAKNHILERQMYLKNLDLHKMLGNSSKKISQMVVSWCLVTKQTQEYTMPNSLQVGLLG